ncbi:MAG: hypothetical protein KAI98_03855 [Gemmatimonadetes bacterium]|nr:hypothetical protein [Gemmatimonadota bacterium]
MTWRNAAAAGLCFATLLCGCSRGADFSPGGPEGQEIAPERTLRTDLERLHRDQVAHLVQYGVYAFTVRELDFRESDGVTITLRWISERSYYALATSGAVECLTAAWDVKSNLPVHVQTTLTAPGTVHCEEGS